jgi:hypothetical protein
MEEAIPPTLVIAGDAEAEGAPGAAHGAEMFEAADRPAYKTAAGGAGLVIGRFVRCGLFLDPFERGDHRRRSGCLGENVKVEPLASRRHRLSGDGLPSCRCDTVDISRHIRG